MLAVVVGLRLGLGPHLGRMVLLALEVGAGALAYIVAMLVLDRGLVLEGLRVASQALPVGDRARRRLDGRAGPRPPDPTAADPESGDRDRLTGS
jgi:hypothetical protein